MGDHRQTGRGQHQGGGGSRGVGGTGYRDADIGLLERRSIVDPVAGHRHDVTTLLQGLDDAVLVLGEHLGKAIGFLDLADRRRWQRPMRHAPGEQRLGRPDVGADTQLPGNLLGDGDVVAGDHLDRDAVAAGFGNGRRGVFAGWIE